MVTESGSVSTVPAALPATAVAAAGSASGPARGTPSQAAIDATATRAGSSDTGRSMAATLSG